MREAILGVIIAFAYSLLIVATTGAQVMNGICDFGNLGKVIGHDNFSFLGATTGCELFYLDGQLFDVTDSSASFAENLKTSVRTYCRNHRPNFYTNNNNNNKFEVLVTWYDRLWLTNGNWTEATPGFYTMPFESVAEGNPITARVDGSHSIRRGVFVVDAFSDLGHFIANDERTGGFVDIPIRISNGDVLQKGTMTDKKEMNELIGFDSDLKRLYFIRRSRTPCTDIGYFDVLTNADNTLTLDPLASINWHICEPFRIFHMSFSNNFVITGVETHSSWRYYISKNGIDDPKCFLEEQTLNAPIIELFVGSEDGNSLHNKIRRQFRPFESFQVHNTGRINTNDMLDDSGMTITLRDSPARKVAGPPSASTSGLIATYPLLISLLAGYFFIC